MRKLTIRLLLTSSFAAFILNSCATNFVKDYSPAKVSAPVFNNHYFSDPAIDYVYKANLSVYGKELSGIFIAKKINNDSHRVVFTTEFGNKLLDFQISDNDFKVNYIVDDLNRKMLINILREDFKLLLKEKYIIEGEFSDKGETILKSSDGIRYNYLFLSKDERKLVRVMNTSKRKERINISYTSENNIFADRIIIQHQNIKLRIEFNFFEQPKQTQ